MERIATIDGKVKVVTEASVRKHLKLEDSDDISILPTIVIFEQLALMGYGLNFQGKGSTISTESHHTPKCAPSTSPPHLSLPPRSSIRKETKVSQPSSPTHTYVAYEAASTGVDVRHRGVATTVTSLDVGQGSDRVLALETDLKQTKKIYGAAYTKLIMKVSTQGEAHNQEDQPEDQLEVLSVAKVLGNTARRNVQTYTRRMEVSTSSRGVSTVSRMISTAEGSVITVGASIPVSTASMIDKGKGIMEEFESDVTETKRQQEQERIGLETVMRLQEQFNEEERQRIDRVHEAAQTFIEEEWENIRARVEADEELTQRLQAEERKKYSKVDQAKMLVDLINQRKRYFAKQKAEAKRKKPMTQAQQRT
nr:hypothetical protein [Tanacetum cinerariifolium]